MEDLAKKILSVEYDFERKREGSHEDVHGICKGYFAGVVLFSGTVIARDNITVSFENTPMLVSNTRQGSIVSLYISPIKKQVEELEGKVKEIKDILEDRVVYFKDIQLTDNPYIDKVRNNAFSLVIEDVRKHTLATFEFLKEGEMLYVPKKH